MTPHDPHKTGAPKSREIAWNGVSFLIPANWELALYKFLKRGVTRVEFEDEFSVRLEAEWVRPRRRLDTQHVIERCEHAAKRLTAKADERREIDGLPKGWNATQYVFRKTEPNRDRTDLDVVTEGLVTAFHVSRDSDFFCSMIFHFYPENTENAADVVRLVASDLKHSFPGALAPWKLYDIAFEVPRAFALENTLFDIGAKLMVFRWRLRRFHLWHFSCADMFLKDDVVMEEWVTGYLNGFAGIRGPLFYPGTNGEITWKRRRRHPLGHRDEITRWCFSYKARCHHDQARNQLVVWVFSYRTEQDLEKLTGRMGAFPLRP